LNNTTKEQYKYFLAQNHWF